MTFGAKKEKPKGASCGQVQWRCSQVESGSGDVEIMQRITKVLCMKGSRSGSQRAVAGLADSHSLGDYGVLAGCEDIVLL